MTMVALCRQNMFWILRSYMDDVDDMMPVIGHAGEWKMGDRIRFGMNFTLKVIALFYLGRRDVQYFRTAPFTGTDPRRI